MDGSIDMADVPKVGLLSGSSSDSNLVQQWITQKTLTRDSTDLGSVGSIPNMDSSCTSSVQETSKRLSSTPAETAESHK